MRPRPQVAVGSFDNGDQSSTGSRSAEVPNDRRRNRACAPARRSESELPITGNIHASRPAGSSTPAPAAPRAQRDDAGLGAMLGAARAGLVQAPPVGAPAAPAFEPDIPEGVRAELAAAS